MLSYCIFSLFYYQVVVAAVHYQQQNDRNEMKKGIKRDLERIEAKRLSKLASQEEKC